VKILMENSPAKLRRRISFWCGTGTRDYRFFSAVMV